MTWSRPITTGEPPGPRAGQTCVAFGTKLCVFGGGDGSRYLNDVFVLDTGTRLLAQCKLKPLAETLTWFQPPGTGTIPPPRSRHTATVVGKSMIVVGGGDEARMYNDVFALDFGTTCQTRSIVLTHSSAGTWVWSKATPQGSLPCSRWGHTTASVGSRLYLHGGHDGQHMLTDLWCLDMGAPQP
jgi:hypothetical protein